MNKQIQSVLTIIIMALLSFIIVVWAGKLRGADSEEESKVLYKADLETSDIASESEISPIELMIWYTDSNMEKYINKVANKYANDYENVTVTSKLVSNVDYLDEINKANIKKEAMPDVYLIDCENLEKAYLGGLAVVNSNETVYNNLNYPETALKAVTYKGKMAAYPLSFETSFLVYNKDYAKKAPDTFDDILTFAEEFDGERAENVQHILEWETKSLLYNYGFIGAYAELGGLNGDDGSIIDLTNRNLKKACKYYHSLYEYFSIDINSLFYSDVMDNFVSGKTVYAIAGVDAIDILSASEIKYGIALFPDLTKKIKTTNLSTTDAVVINPYSKNMSNAKRLAKYLTYNCVDELYSLTGAMPCRILDSYSDENFNMIMEQYKMSKSLPKMIAVSDYWVELEITLNKIWIGEDINTVLTDLSDRVKSQLQP